MCNRFADSKSFAETKKIANEGNLSNVDLTIGDVSEEDIKNLPKETTLANFGKLKKDANNADIVLGIINMIFETIGMMAVFAIKNDEIKEVIITGTITSISQAKNILNKIEKLYDISFIIPENAEYATAFGAIAYYLKYKN